MINSDYKDMLSIFNALGVEYLVVGAYALAAHGNPRATGDIDLWVRPTPENSQRVWQALQQFGAPRRDVAPEDFMTPDTVFQIGVAPNRIDIITTITAVDFEVAWERRVPSEFGDVAINVLGVDDLIANKSATGRLKDAADAEWLQTMTRGTPQADPESGA